MYTQSGGKLEIVIRKESLGGGTGGTTGTGGDGGTPPEETTKTWRTNIFGSENPKRINRVIKTNATHAIAIAKQVAGLAINYKLGGIGYQHGDQAYQQTAQRTMEIVDDGLNMASSIGMGALYGSWGGPIGIALGATFAAISTGASTATKYANRERDYSMKMFKIENGIAYQRARAGINLTTGRLR